MCISREVPNMLASGWNLSSICKSAFLAVDPPLGKVHFQSFGDYGSSQDTLEEPIMAKKMN